MIDLDEIELTRVEPVIQEFPDGSRPESISMTFSLDGCEIKKRIQLSTCVKLTSKMPLEREALYQITKTIREVERDFAFMKFGQDWRNHVRWNIFWDVDTKPKEQRLVDLAAKMSAVELLIENA